MNDTWVVIYEHRHGSDMWFCHSKDEVDRSLASIALTYIDEVPEEIQLEILKAVVAGDLQLAISTYFEASDAEAYEAARVPENPQDPPPTLEALQAQAAEALAIEQTEDEGDEA